MMFNPQHWTTYLCRIFIFRFIYIYRFWSLCIHIYFYYRYRYVCIQIYKCIIYITPYLLRCHFLHSPNWKKNKHNISCILGFFHQPSTLLTLTAPLKKIRILTIEVLVPMGQLAVGTLKGLCKGILAVSSGLWNYVPRRVKRCNLPMLHVLSFWQKKRETKTWLWQKGAVGLFPTQQKKRDWWAQGKVEVIGEQTKKIDDNSGWFTSSNLSRLLSYKQPQVCDDTSETSQIWEPFKSSDVAFNCELR